jgi:rubrerythrin
MNIRKCILLSSTKQKRKAIRLRYVFTFAMKAEEVHAGLYKDALENLDNTEEVFYYLCPVCGTY